MSTTEIRDLLKSHFTGRDTALATISAQPHFVPLDIESIGVVLLSHIKNKSDSLNALTEFREAVIQYLSTKHRKGLLVEGTKLLNISTGELITEGNIKANTPAVVYEKGNIIGVFYANVNSYSATLKHLFTGYLNKVATQVLNKYSTYGSTKFNIGHIPVVTTKGKKENIGKNIGNTPVLLQLTNVIAAARETLDTAELTTSQKIILDRFLRKSELLTTKFFNIDHKYGTEIYSNISKNFSDILVSVKANIVIVQDARDNQKFGQEERALIQKVKTLLHKIHFSNSFDEEIGSRLSAALSGKKTVNTKVSKNIERIVIKNISKINVSTSNVILPKIRNLNTGQYTSITTLKSLLNYHLHDVVAANMGDGEERSTLNYRTGRFATSTNVENVSISRDGAITAFYTYMKNPYATFAKGGRQQNPRSRDPTILISKSIRDIAIKMGIDRLRTVLV